MPPIARRVVAYAVLPSVVLCGLTGWATASSVRLAVQLTRRHRQAACR